MGVGLPDLTPVDQITIWVGMLPPSINNVRVHRRRGGVAYSEEAQAFDAHVRTLVAPAACLDITRLLAARTPTDMLEMTYVFFIHHFYAEKWWEPDRKGIRKEASKSPYANLDVTNRIKVAEDALVRLTRLDDHLVRTSTCHKLPAHTEDEQGFLATIRLVNEHEIPFIKHYSLSDTLQEQRLKDALKTHIRRTHAPARQG